MVALSIATFLFGSLAVAASVGNKHHQNLVATTPSSSHGPYAGHKIIRLPVASDDKVALNERLINTAGVISVLSVGSKHIDVQVDSQFASLLSLDSSDDRVIVENVQALVDKEMNRLAVSRANLASLSTQDLYAPDNWFSEYHKYNEIVAWFKDLAQKHPDLIEFIPSIGKTYLKKDIIAIKVTSSVNKATKSQLWFHSGDHAREWIGPATVQYFVHALVNDHAANPALLDSAELIIVPLMNVDGYEHTWAGTRLWRKNRRPIKKDFFGSVGVDLNRNWPAHWGEGGSSDMPFSDVYMGPEAGSEPEVKALIIITRFFVYIHSFVTGWTTDDAPDEKLLKEVGDGIRDVIKKTSGKKYVSQREIDLYAASGTASDWFYDEEVQEWLPDRRLYAYTIELRPSADEANGGQGFILPPEQIIPTGKEIYEAVKYFIDFAVKNPLKVKKF
ncbi:UNVERIFIED_CONTAM: hypothetical protein HDU68_002684 [Siphonaria sp. JEL0065]|nr:hypothetical protein HDU68_002684 [Siphonaria sp. JEL0065]